VTRCATQITMSRGEKWKAELRAGGAVHAVATKKEIAKHIQELTTTLCGDSGFCADQSIEVTLVAPDAPDLTIIDLPGIVRTATSGQEETVIGDVNTLIQKYLEQPRTIVLAVIAANVDIATNEIIERAAKVDPTGCRTMGVLTKPDLVDKGGENEVIGVLSNNTKPLQHGYVMLKNRSQAELSQEVTLEEARAKELEYFEQSAYKDGDHRLGVQALTTALTELLVTQIESALPHMASEIDAVLKRTSEELSSFGAPPPDTNPGRRSAALTMVRELIASLRLVTNEADYRDVGDNMKLRVLQVENSARKEFADNVQKTRPGFDGEDDSFDCEVTETMEDDEEDDEEDENTARDDGVPHYEVGAVIKDLHWTGKRSIMKIGEITTVHNKSHGYVKAKVAAMRSYFRGDVASRIKAERGRELPGFMSFNVFSGLMTEYSQRWKAPTDAFNKSVSKAVFDAAIEFVDVQVATKAPLLAEHLKSTVSAHIASVDSEAAQRLSALAEQELLPCTENHYLYDTINKIRNQRTETKMKALDRHPSFEGYVSVVSVVAALNSSVGNDSNESQEVQDMIDMLSAYWKLAMKRYVDEASMIVTDVFTAPKRLRDMESKLIEMVVESDGDLLEQFFVQNKRREKRRRDLNTTLENMQKAKRRIVEGF